MARCRSIFGEGWRLRYTLNITAPDWIADMIVVQT